MLSMRLNSLQHIDFVIVYFMTLCAYDATEMVLSGMAVPAVYSCSVVSVVGISNLLLSCMVYKVFCDVFF